jgi:hypothetical protein
MAKSKQNAKFVPAVINITKKYLEDTLDWMPVSGIYQAKGNENYLALSCFSIPWCKACKTIDGKRAVYYFVDDVSLYQISNLNFERFNGNILDLSGVLFDKNQSVLKKEYHAVLDQLYEFLINNNFLNINIWAYTSKEGTKERNARLSKERAEVIKIYLLNNGLDADRIKTVGKGYKDLDKRTVEIEFL